MPTFKLSKDAVITIAGTQYQGIFREADVPKEFAEVDTTVFGAGARSYIAGLQDESVSFSGLFSRTEFNALAALAGTIVALIYEPEGTTTGTPEATCNVLVTRVSPGASVGEAISLELAGRVTGGLTWATNP